MIIKEKPVVELTLSVLRPLPSISKWREVKNSCSVSILLVQRATFECCDWCLSQIQLSCRYFGWPHIYQLSASPKQTRRVPRQMILHRRVVTCVVPPTNAFQLPECCKKLRGTRASWKMLSKHGSTFLPLPENEECQSPVRGFTWEAAALLGFTSPVRCLITAGEILLVALGLLIPLHLVIYLELVPIRSCCTTSPPESWICLIQIL